MSSHWEAYLSRFEYKDGAFSGLLGFGGKGRPGDPIHRLAHRLLQRPFRKMGEGFAGFPEIARAAESVAGRLGRQFDLDVLRQALTLALLKDRGALEADPGPVLVIGDGFGTMTSLLLELFPERKAVFVNLTRTLMVDASCVRLARPGDRVCWPDAPEDYLAALADAGTRAVAVRADDCGFLRGGPIALALNIASMQEMDPVVVAEYFQVLRASRGPRTLLYCCNRLEKTLPDGTRVEFLKYPWRPEDKILVDGLCPWHQEWYRPFPPFYRPYDGPIWHRLAELDKGPGK
jgi:hypothetical protein